MWETQVQSLGREDPFGEGNGNPLQYSFLENSMERGAWRATVPGVAKSQTRVSMHACVQETKTVEATVAEVLLALK